MKQARHQLRLKGGTAGHFRPAASISNPALPAPATLPCPFRALKPFSRIQHSIIRTIEPDTISRRDYQRRALQLLHEGETKQQQLQIGVVHIAHDAQANLSFATKEPAKRADYKYVMSGSADSRTWSHNGDPYDQYTPFPNASQASSESREGGAGVKKRRRVAVACRGCSSRKTRARFLHPQNGSRLKSNVRSATEGVQSVLHARKWKWNASTCSLYSRRPNGKPTRRT